MYSQLSGDVLVALPILTAISGLTLPPGLPNLINLKQAEKPVLLVASTDMTHYESQEQAEAKDRMAIDKILALDPQGLLETVRGHNISMCGVIPTTVTLVASLTLEASSVELIRYATSGDATGDYVQVVGYASFIIE